MRAVILAAGRGSRMEGLTEDRPKCLLEFKNKSLLDWQLTALKNAGIAKIGIVTGYKREMLKERGLQEFYNSRWAETNMVSSLECAQEWLVDSPCVVSYADIIYGSDAVSALADSPADIAVLYDVNWRKLWEKRFGDPLLDAETFKVDAENKILEIGKKPNKIDEIQGQYMGLIKITPAGWDGVAQIRNSLPVERCDAMDMTGTLQMVIDAGVKQVYAVPFTGTWAEFDSQHDFTVIGKNDDDL